MDDRHRAVLRRNRVALVIGIKSASLIVFEMLEDKLISEFQAQRILCKPTPIERAQTLISFLPSRGPNIFIPFIQILDKYYPDLSTLLLQSLLNL